MRAPTGGTPKPKPKPSLAVGKKGQVALGPKKPPKLAPGQRSWALQVGGVGSTAIGVPKRGNVSTRPTPKTSLTRRAK